MKNDAPLSSDPARPAAPVGPIGGVGPVAPVAPRLIPAERARHLLHTLLFATLVCAGLLGARWIYAQNVRFGGFLLNLLLAWIPLGLALLIRRWPSGRPRGWFWGTLVLWILFFPNCFYLVTDLIHMKKFGTDGVYRWFDLVMTTAFACTGMFLGSLALYLMHLLVRERFGWRKGWAFAGGMLALGSFGIYLGRALRLNSWDVVARPLKLVGDLSSLGAPEPLKEVAAFSVTFFFFSLAVYALIVSMARLHEASPERRAE